MLHFIYQTFHQMKSIEAMIQGSDVRRLTKIHPEARPFNKVFKHTKTHVEYNQRNLHRLPQHLYFY